MVSACPECGHKDTKTPVTYRCLWCYDVRLLAGGYESPRFEKRWTEAEQAGIRLEAQLRRRELELSAEERRAQKQAEKLKPDSQEALT